MTATADISRRNIHHNNLHTDYKAEILALNLMKYYDEVDDVFLKRLGDNNRPFHKDIESVSSQAYELGQLIVSIGTYREGIYDYLPEGVFHPPSLGSHHGRTDQIIAGIQQQKKVEASARKFFQPFEMETYYLELRALSLEREYDITGSSDLLLGIMHELWPLLGALDEDTARIFIYLLPYFHTARASRKWFEKCLAAFLQVPVNISLSPNRISDIEAVSAPLTVSRFRLGISTVLSGSHMDGERNWAIQFGPIPQQDLTKYMPHGHLRKLLHILYDHCVPLTMRVEEYFIAGPHDDSFQLGMQHEHSRLGFSTFL